jgi:hypothetical protein
MTNKYLDIQRSIYDLTKIGFKNYKSDMLGQVTVMQTRFGFK